MSRRCDICGKGVQVGYNVSHSNLKTKKRWKPNLKKVQVIEQGRISQKTVCTRCLRSGAVTKPLVNKQIVATA